MAPRPPVVFPGEKGFAELECLAEGYSNRGKATGCRYHFARNERRYVDVRDLTGMDKRAFRKVGDASPDEADRAQESA